ncbi:MAG TPA: hypothetical protein VK909_18765 [Anaerolineales bacterium]|nr:hypothetical protein [Anaerolineales bacterium]
MVYRSNQNQDIIQLLLRLKAYEQEYPIRLFSMRRVSYLTRIAECVGSWLRVRV